MIIKVTKITAEFYNKSNQQKPTTKFYQPQTPKNKVKSDFGVVLDRELNRLHFDKII